MLTTVHATLRLLGLQRSQTRQLGPVVPLQTVVLRPGGKQGGGDEGESRHSKVIARPFEVFEVVSESDTDDLEIVDKLIEAQWVYARLEVARERTDAERRLRLSYPIRLHQASSDGVVHRLLEADVLAPSPFFQAGRKIVLKGQRRSH